VKTSTVVCIGASAGGVQAIARILSGIPKLFPFPIVVVQHIAPQAQISPRLIFGSHFSGQVIEALDKMSLDPGNAYFAPPGYHLLIESDSSLALSQDDPVKYARPSIDVFFESAADSLAKDTVAILLTGASDDGASGLRDVQRCGGVAIAQDPRTAEVPTMPQAAIDLFHPDHVLDLEGITRYLKQLSERGNEACHETRC
jgi:two-component system chemotaxis response regulator CheB